MGRLIQNNFSGGCLSPSLFGRSDLQAYYKGCAKAENFVVTKEGSIRKRHGISSMFELPASFDNCKIVPYQFDRTQGGFVLMYANGNDISCAYYLKDGTARGTATITGGIVSGTSASEQIKALQTKQIGDQIWICNGYIFKIITITDNNTISVTQWTQTAKPSRPSSISAYGYRSDGSSYEPTTGRTISYAAYVVKNGVMSNRRAVNKIWSKDWLSGYWIEVTVGLNNITDYDYVILCKKIGGTYGEVARWYPEDVSGNSVEFRDENISAGEGVYAQTNVLGTNFANPTCVDCFQQRKVFANATSNSTKLPMTMWFSEVGNIDNFYASRPSSDSDAFSPTISSTGPSFIRWIVTYNEMMVLLTDSGLFSVGFAQTQGFSASSCRISRFSNLAVSPTIQPVVTDAGIVFVGADNKTIYTAAYDLNENMLKPMNRSVLVEHLTRESPVKAIALQNFPNNVVWVILENGRYATFTFERNEEVYAWSDGYVTDGKILDAVAVGSVTDPSVSIPFERTYGDIVLVVEKSGHQYVCKFNTGYADTIGGATTNVKSTLVTLRSESQDKTISGYQKNVKDILLRLFETGGISVKPTDGGAGIPLVGAKVPAGILFTGDVKVMPRGCISETGQMTFVSDNDDPCEVLQIVTTMEVAG